MSFSKQILTNKFSCVDETQASIVSISQWCLFHYRHCQETVEVWNEFIVKSKKKLPLFYLCNEIIQNARSTKKNEFLLHFSQVLPKLLAEIYPSMSDLEKSKIKRIIDVWKQRSIFSDRILKNLYESITETVEPRTVSATVTSQSANVLPEIVPLSSRMTKLLKKKKTMDSTLNKLSKDYFSLFDSETLPAPDVYLSKLKQLEGDINKHCEDGGTILDIRREVVDILQNLVSQQETLISQEEQTIQNLRDKLSAVNGKQSELESLMNGDGDEEDEDDVAPMYTKGSEDESESDNDNDEARVKRQKVVSELNAPEPNGINEANEVQPNETQPYEAQSNEAQSNENPAYEAQSNEIPSYGAQPDDEQYEPPAPADFQSSESGYQPDENASSGYNPEDTETANPNLASLLSKLT